MTDIFEESESAGPLRAEAPDAGVDADPAAPAGDRDAVDEAGAPIRTLPAWLAGGLGAAGGLLVMAVLGVVLLGGRATPVANAQPAGAGGGPPASTPAYEAPAVGYRAPRFTLKGLDDRAVDLTAFRGHPVWVNLWASWCGPCRAEMPEMKTLYDRYQAAGLVILGVDLQENAKTVQEFVRSNGYDWTFVLDTDGTVARNYNASGIPTHAFIDADGVIRAYQIGGLAPATMEANLARIMPK